MQLSNGWLARFKDRNRIEFCSVQGESGSAETHAIDETLPGLIEKMSEISDSDV